LNYNDKLFKINTSHQIGKQNERLFIEKTLFIWKMHHNFLKIYSFDFLKFVMTKYSIFNNSYTIDLNITQPHWCTRTHQQLLNGTKYYSNLDLISIFFQNLIILNHTLKKNLSFATKKSIIRCFKQPHNLV
jgi:hypothetical protein